ncbi:glycosyltransferase family 4 protein [Rhodococcus fascians]|uniref:glycosyltransferase family 4 protein n=1 Tax=Rhodococcoides fascians TaxID=1828 RepID=UPI0024B76D5B|nr:glycosyltransferase family 4 protein [Rhodococcus fascians]MDJ0002923.1 glycosyltransferase family 4 protein [Rhodococcus fascians]
MNQVKVYAVVSQFPIPLDRGDAVRTLQILQALNAQVELCVLSVLRADSKPEDISQLSELLEDAEIFTFADADVSRGSILKRLMRWTKSIANQEPPWIFGRRSPEMKAHIDSLPDNDSIFLAVSEATGTYIDSRKTWHWDKMNVLGESSKQDIRFASGLSARLRSRLLHQLCVKFEKRAIANTGSISVTSDLELLRLQAAYDVTRHPIYVWPSCAPVAELKDERRNNTVRVVAWLGSLTYPSNIDGLVLFLETAWTGIPDSKLRLKVIGRGLTRDREIELQKSFPNVEFTGFVEDLADALTDVQAAVAPLWSGAGVKMKTLTLMGFGIPVFGTTVAFEGIDVDDMNVTFDDPVQLFESIRDTSDEQLARLGAEMKRRIREYHSSENLKRSIIDTVTKLEHGI